MPWEDHYLAITPQLVHADLGLCLWLVALIVSLHGKRVRDDYEENGLC
jgi:hypothetical protein